jgi:hypothetical protein
VLAAGAIVANADGCRIAVVKQHSFDAMQSRLLAFRPPAAELDLTIVAPPDHSDSLGVGVGVLAGFAKSFEA